jgi:hypothetical protein
MPYRSVHRMHSSSGYKEPSNSDSCTKRKQSGRFDVCCITYHVHPCLHASLHAEPLHGCNLRIRNPYIMLNRLPTYSLANTCFLSLLLTLPVCKNRYNRRGHLKPCRRKHVSIYALAKPNKRRLLINQTYNKKLCYKGR